MTALLEGGPADRIEMEIDPGQTALELGLLEGWRPERSDPPGLPDYRYAGRVDDRGRAVFVPVEG